MSEITPDTTVTAVHYDADPFEIWRGEQTGRGAALGMFGLVGGLIEAGFQNSDAKEAGAKFVSMSQLTDPILTIEARFLEAWQRQLGLRKVEGPERLSKDDPKDLEKRFGHGYVIDFVTTRWEIVPKPRKLFSADPLSYRIAYAARARLVRLSDKKVVWQSVCELDDVASKNMNLSLSEIDGSDQGQAVKAEINKLTANCADTFWSDFFGRDIPEAQGAPA